MGPFTPSPLRTATATWHGEATDIPAGRKSNCEAGPVRDIPHLFGTGLSQLTPKRAVASSYTEYLLEKNEAVLESGNYRPPPMLARVDRTLTRVGAPPWWALLIIGAVFLGVLVTAMVRGSR